MTGGRLADVTLQGGSSSSGGTLRPVTLSASGHTGGGLFLANDTLFAQGTTGFSGRVGTLAQALQDAGFSGAGKPVISMALATTLDSLGIDAHDSPQDVTLRATGTVAHVGTGGVLAPLAFLSQGAVAADATAADTLADATLAGVGRGSPSALLAQTLAPLTGSLTGTTTGTLPVNPALQAGGMPRNIVHRGQIVKVKTKKDYDKLKALIAQESIVVPKIVVNNRPKRPKQQKKPAVIPVQAPSWTLQYQAPQFQPTQIDPGIQAMFDRHRQMMALADAAMQHRRRQQDDEDLALLMSDA